MLTFGKFPDGTPFILAEDLKACARHGLLRCEKGKWFILHNAEFSEGGTRDSRIETAAQSRPSLH